MKFKIKILKFMNQKKQQTNKNPKEVYTGDF